MNLPLSMEDHPSQPEAAHPWSALQAVVGTKTPGVGIRAKLFSHHQMQSPRQLKTRHFRKKIKEKCVPGSESQHCPHNPWSSLSSPKGCVIPSYSPRTREEIPLFEHTSASVPQPWSFPTEACPHFAPDHKAFALHLAGTTSLVFE